MKDNPTQSKASGIALDTHIGMTLLYSGIAVFMAMLFFPQWTELLSKSLLAALHIDVLPVSRTAVSICSAFGIQASPRMAPPAVIA